MFDMFGFCLNQSNADRLICTAADSSEGHDSVFCRVPDN